MEGLLGTILGISNVSRRRLKDFIQDPYSLPKSMLGDYGVMLENIKEAGQNISRPDDLRTMLYGGVMRDDPSTLAAKEAALSRGVDLLAEGAGDWLPDFGLLGATKGVGTRAAKNVKKAAMGAVDFKSMSPEQRFSASFGDVHIKQMPDGKYVGSPDIYSPGELSALRRKLYKEVRSVLEKPWVNEELPWYGRQRTGIEEIAGPSPAVQHNVAKGIGIYSPQATPAVNFSALANQHQYYSLLGDPSYVPRTGSQANKYARQLMGEEVSMGPKTGNFAVSSDPTLADPYMSTNDIWIGRLLGYKNKDGKQFSRGFTQQEHAFVQGEMQRLTATARNEKWGGRGDWTVEEIQALPWVELKGRQLASKGKKPYEKGIAEAQRTTLEELPRNTVYMTNEVLGSKDIGHMNGLLDQPLDVRAAYTNERGNFIDPETGRAILFDSFPQNLQRPAVPFTGSYEGTSNPGIAWRLIGGREMVKDQLPRAPGKLKRAANQPAPLSGPFVADWTHQAMRVPGGVYGLLNPQEMVGWSQTFPLQSGMKVRDTNAARIGLLGAPTGEQMSRIAAAGKLVNLPDVVHHGGGNVTLTNFNAIENGAPVNIGRKQASALREGLLGLDVNEVLPARIDAGNVWLGDAWKQPQGSGAVSRRILDEIEKNPELGWRAIDLMDANPAVKSEILNQITRDEKYAKMYGASPREDVMRMRRAIVNKFGSLRAYFEQVKKTGGAGFPAVFLAPMLEEEGQGR